MKLTENNKEITVNTLGNWPLIEDLLIKWGYEPMAINIAKNEDANLVAKNIDELSCELSAWGIPWKRTKWEY